MIKTLERTELKGGTLRVPTHNKRETFRWTTFINTKGKKFISRKHLQFMYNWLTRRSEGARTSASFAWICAILEGRDVARGLFNSSTRPHLNFWVRLELDEVPWSKQFPLQEDNHYSILERGKFRINPRMECRYSIHL